MDAATIVKKWLTETGGPLFLDLVKWAKQPSAHIKDFKIVLKGLGLVGGAVRAARKYGKAIKTAMNEAKGAIKLAKSTGNLAAIAEALKKFQATAYVCLP